MSYDPPGRDPFAAPDDTNPELQPPSPEQAPAEGAPPATGSPSAGSPAAEPSDRAWQPGAVPWYDAPYDGDPYADVPASLELAYTSADLGLSPNAYERTFPYERRARRAANARARRVGREIIETLILAGLIFLAVRGVIQNFRVEGASMDPSLDNGQYLLVNKAIYFRVDMDKIHNILPFVPGDGDDERHLFRAPRRGDVVVFRFHLDDNRDFIKRVIGVPGDTVEVRDGTVFIDGQPLTEDYILAPPDYTYGPRVVPAGHYFVLGDNRRNSYDSHAWGGQCGADELCEFVPEENIIGQAWIGYWPWEDLGLINNKDIEP